jgi:hypothetical protein
MMNKKENPIQTAGTDSEEVLNRLANFHVIQNPSLRSVFSWLPILLILLVFVDWLIGSGSFSLDTFRLTGLLTIAAILAATHYLFESLPQTLETLWKRDLLFLRAEKSDPSPFLTYLNQFQGLLLGRYAWVLGLACALGGLLATYPVQYYLKAGKFPFDFIGMISYYLWGHFSIIAAILGYLVGLLIWKIGVIAYFISLIGDHFTLKIQPNHPDKCGGFKPLGDLTLNIAIIILIPATMLAIWGFITTFFDNPALQLYVTLWGGLFRQWLVILGVLSLFAFVQPLYKIHLRMDENAHQIQSELDALSQKIEALSFELRTQAYLLTPQQGDEKLRAIEFMKKVYEENSHIPTWPFAWKTILQFASAQVVPVLSLLGTSGPVVEIVKGLFVVAH